MSELSSQLPGDNWFTRLDGGDITGYRSLHVTSHSAHTGHSSDTGDLHKSQCQPPHVSPLIVRGVITGCHVSDKRNDRGPDTKPHWPAPDNTVVTTNVTRHLTSVISCSNQGPDKSGNNKAETKKLWKKEKSNYQQVISIDRRFSLLSRMDFLLSPLPRKPLVRL